MPETQTIVQQPWQGQAQYLTPGWQAGLEQVLNRPQQFYPGSTTVPFSNQTQQALGMAEQRALQGSPITQQAQQTVANTMGGQYINPGLGGMGKQPGMSGQWGVGPGQTPGFGGTPGQGGSYTGPTQAPQAPQVPGMGYSPAQAPPQQKAFGGLGGMNPYLQGVTQSIANTVGPAVSSQFAGAGRLGSGAHEDTLTRRIADAAAPYAFQNYENERARQLQAAGMAPGLANQDYADIGQLQQVGSQREALAGQQLSEAQARFNFGQQEPTQRIGDYLGLVGGNRGSQTTQPVYQNQGLSGLGGALAGAQVGNYFQQPGLGAIAGGLLGLFG